MGYETFLIHFLWQERECKFLTQQQDIMIAEQVCRDKFKDCNISRIEEFGMKDFNLFY